MVECECVLILQKDKVYSSLTLAVCVCVYKTQTLRASVHRQPETSEVRCVYFNHVSKGYS